MEKVSYKIGDCKELLENRMYAGEGTVSLYSTKKKWPPHQSLQIVSSCQEQHVLLQYQPFLSETSYPSPSDRSLDAFIFKQGYVSHRGCHLQAWNQDWLEVYLYN